MLQQPEPEDYVIATGVTTSVREFVVRSFSELGIKIGFKGKGVDEKGFIESADTRKWLVKPEQEVVCIDPMYFRPSEVDLLIGDATKAQKKLGWMPKYTLDALINEMIVADLKLAQQEKHSKLGGFDIKSIQE